MCWHWCDGINVSVGMLGDQRLVIFFFFCFFRDNDGKKNKRKKRSVFCQIINGRFLDSV
jgi:hypothetical protein